MSVETDTLAAVGPRWEDAKTIWRRMSCWSFVSVRHQLRQLEEAGKIDGRFASHPNGTITLFRRCETATRD